MRRFLSSCLVATALIGGAVSLSSCVVAPPRPVHHVRHERGVWVPGHWARGHVWVEGHWHR